MMAWPADEDKDEGHVPAPNVRHMIRVAQMLGINLANTTGGVLTCDLSNKFLGNRWQWVLQFCDDVWI